MGGCVDSPRRCLLISSSSVPRFSIPRLPCQLKSRDESVDGFKKTILRCGQKRLLCPTEGTVESFPVLECPEEGVGVYGVGWLHWEEKRAQDDGGAGGQRHVHTCSVQPGFNCLDRILRFVAGALLQSNKHQLKVPFGLVRVTHSARGPLKERKGIKPWKMYVSLRLSVDRYTILYWKTIVPTEYRGNVTSSVSIEKSRQGHIFLQPIYVFHYLTHIRACCILFIHDVDSERYRKSKGACQHCPYLPPICAQKLPRSEQWIWVTVNNPPDHKGILSRSILHLPVVTIWIVEPTIFVAQFFFSALSSSNTLISPICCQCHLSCYCHF